MITLEQIQARLAETIKQSGLSQTAIAKQIGVCQQAVSAYVKGTKMPALDTFAKLFVVLDLDANEILCVK